MKRPPQNPEFSRFTSAMRQLMTVSKTDLVAAMTEEKAEKAGRAVQVKQARQMEKKGKRLKPSSPSLGASPKQAN
jgi:hypothetical protein